MMRWLTNVVEVNSCGLPLPHACFAWASLSESWSWPLYIAPPSPSCKIVLPFLLSRGYPLSLSLYISLPLPPSLPTPEALALNSIII